jgi:heme/copper-type cytochrome/quinol oxidase subunit 2
MKGQWGKFTGYFLGVLLVTAAITFLPPLIDNSESDFGWLPKLISSEGKSIDALFWGLVILSIVIFAIVGAVVIYSLVHFRAAPGDLSDGEHIHGNAKMEIAWIVIPSIIVFVIGILSYLVMEENEIGLYDKAASKDKGAATMAVDVRGFSFGWQFRFEDVDGKPLGGGSEQVLNPELVLPVDTVVRFNVMSCSGKEAIGRVREQERRELNAEGEENEFAEIQPGICEKEWDATTKEDREKAIEEEHQLKEIDDKRADGKDLTDQEQALHDQQPRFHGDHQYADVTHAFWVPEARMKIDAVSGLRTYVQWEATRVTRPDDRFQVVCAELCGSGHNGMRTDMCVVDKDTFDWWVGLDEDGRSEATCVNLRLLNCLDDTSNQEDLVAQIAKVTEKDPEATCDDVEEIAA